MKRFSSSKRLTSRLRIALRLSLVLCLLAVVSSGCERRMLEVMEPSTVHVRLKVRWLTYYGQVPPGMTVMLFNGENEPIAKITTSMTEVELDNLKIGHYRVVLFNKSEHDFPSMRFDNLNSYDQMTVRATTFTPSRYTAWTKGEIFTYDPEQLGTLVSEFDITEEMLLNHVTFYPYKEWIHMEIEEGDVKTYVIEVDPKPVVTRLFVRVHIKNIRSMASIEGHITGFSDGWHMTEEHSTVEDDTRYLLDKWTVRDDPDFIGNGGNGWTVAMTTLWGEPPELENWRTRPKDQHLLTLHITLTNDSTVDYRYHVGHKVRYITPTWDELWSYTDVVTKTMVVTIWDNDPGDDPGKPDDPSIITPDPDNPDDPSEPDLPDLPDGPGGDEGKAGFGVDVEHWEFGGRVEIPI